MTPPTIRFGTSGWRAVIAEDFTFGNARRVIAAIARVLTADGSSGGLVLVGYDTRFLADRFAAEAARVLGRHGFAAEVSARPVPTPVLAFEIRRRGAAGAVNFTASHNPSQYLGIKFSTSDGAPALPEITKRIEAEILAIPEESVPPETAVPRFDPAPPYLADLASKVDAREVGKGRAHFSLDFRYGTSAGFLDAWLETTGSVAVAAARQSPIRSSGGIRRSAASRSFASWRRSSGKRDRAWAWRPTATPTVSAFARKMAPTCSPTRSWRSSWPTCSGERESAAASRAASPRPTPSMPSPRNTARLSTRRPSGSSTSGSCFSKERSSSGARRAPG